MGSLAAILVEHDAIIEKFVGDEVVGLFLPFLAGSEHARRALEAASRCSRLRVIDPPTHRGHLWVPGCTRGPRSSGSLGPKTLWISRPSVIE